MDFHQLRIFSEVYRLRSFTMAAEALHISQPTISEHIKNLENELSCALFDRLGRSILPTTEAEQLFPRAQELLDSLQRLREDLLSSGQMIRGRIVFGASTIPGTYIIPGQVVQFSRQHPQVTFEVIISDTAAITRMVLEHQLFCGIVGARTASAKLLYEPFVRDELVMVGVPEICPGDRIGPADLGALPLLLREKGSGTRKSMEEYFSGIGIKPDHLNIVAILGSTAAVKEAALQGLGLTVLSRLAVREELQNNLLQEVKITNLTMTRDFFLVRHSQRTLPNHYQAFCAQLQGEKPAIGGQ